MFDKTVKYKAKTEYDSKCFQKLVFKEGVRWSLGGANIDPSKRFLFLRTDLEYRTISPHLTYSDDLFYFRAHPNTEVIHKRPFPTCEDELLNHDIHYYLEYATVAISPCNTQKIIQIKEQIKQLQKELEELENNT